MEEVVDPGYEYVYDENQEANIIIFEGEYINGIICGKGKDTVYRSVKLVCGRTDRVSATGHYYSGSCSK